VVAGAIAAAIGFGAVLPIPVEGAVRPRPVVFEANQGQADPGVRFITRLPGHTVLLSATGATFLLHPVEAGPRQRPGAPAQSPTGTAPAAAGAVVTLRLEGARPDPDVHGVEPLAARVNYYRGRDRSRWLEGVPTFQRVRYRDVYPGVDVVFYGTGRRLEYDFVLSPGADPRTIGLVFAGARPRLADDGEVVLDTAAGELRLRAPVSYQTIEGQRVPVASRFAIAGEASPAPVVRIAVGPYDARHPLVIDPLAYLITPGGSADDVAHGIAADSNRNAYVTGSTQSTDFMGDVPGTLRGASDAFVLKLGVNGALVWATYFGGSGDDEGMAIAVSPEDEPFVTGFTTSNNFPTECIASFFGLCSPAQTARAGGRDAFVARFRSNGVLLYSTYLGGSGDDAGLGIAVAGRVANVTGSTRSADFPTAGSVGTATALAGGADAFIVRVNSNGTNLSLSRYLGGTGDDEGQGVTVDGSLNILVTGSTSSADFPVLNAVFPTPRGGVDAFVTKTTMAGAILYSTYLGGSDEDIGYGIAVDPGGNAFVTGMTRSSNFPRAPCFTPPFGGGTICFTIQSTRRGPSDAFVTKLDAAGVLHYSTHLGGTGDEAGLGIAVQELSAESRAVVTGFTTSSDFPGAGGLQPSPGGGLDAFLATIAADGGSVFSASYLGGPGDESGQAVFHRNFETWLAGFTTAAGDRDAFVAFLAVGDVGQAEIGLSPTGVTASSGSFVLSVNGTNLTAGSTVLWNGSPRATTFAGSGDGSGSLLATITAADVAAAGPTVAISVVNPLGGTTNFGFGAGATLGVFAVTPGTIPAGSGDVALTITGGLFSDGTLLLNNGFPAAASQVLWNGSPVATTFIDLFTVQAAIPAALVQAPGAAVVKVLNVYGAQSGCLPDFKPVCPSSPDMPVTMVTPNPAPALASLAPSSVAVGTGAFTLTVTGSGFVAASVVRWNGADRPTTFVNDGTLEAAIPAGDVAATGEASVRVFSPAPGGGLSNALTFTVRPPDQTLTVTRTGSASGTVSSEPAGIACPGTCAAPFPHGTAVTLTATPAAGATFAGWSGACTGTAPCNLTMSEPRSATAAFAQVFSAPTLTAGVSVVRAADLAELRAAVDALRSHCACGLGPVAWTDPVLAPGVTPVKSVHVTELRTALAAVFTAGGLTPPAYTDPGLAPGALVRAVHVTELRAAVRNLE
jgi:hypothetical protein